MAVFRHNLEVFLLFTPCPPPIQFCFTKAYNHGSKWEGGEPPPNNLPLKCKSASEYIWIQLELTSQETSLSLLNHFKIIAIELKWHQHLQQPPGRHGKAASHPSLFRLLRGRIHLSFHEITDKAHLSLNILPGGCAYYISLMSNKKRKQLLSSRQERKKERKEDDIRVVVQGSN